MRGLHQDRGAPRGGDIRTALKIGMLKKFTQGHLHPQGYVTIQLR